jgi:hypothetical protein
LVRFDNLVLTEDRSTCLSRKFVYSSAPVLSKREKMKRDSVSEGDPLGLHHDPAQKISTEEAKEDKKQKTAMAQYTKFKKKYPDFLLFFMLGTCYIFVPELILDRRFL